MNNTTSSPRWLQAVARLVTTKSRQSGGQAQPSSAANSQEEFDWGMSAQDALRAGAEVRYK